MENSSVSGERAELEQVRALIGSEWVNIEDEYPPSNCVVFTSKGTDVGIGVWTGRYWRNLSGHRVGAADLPDWWQGIRFSRSAEAQAQPAPHVSGGEHAELERLITEMREREKLNRRFGFIGRWANRIEALLAHAQAEPGLQVRIENATTVLYRKFKEWSKRKFSADDVTWCEVKDELKKLILAARREAQPAPRSVCYDCGDPFDKCVLGEAQPASSSLNGGVDEERRKKEAQPVADAPTLTFGNGDYSCASCGFGMKEPCEHWRNILRAGAQPPEPSAIRERLQKIKCGGSSLWDWMPADLQGQLDAVLYAPADGLREDVRKLIEDLDKPLWETLEGGFTHNVVKRLKALLAAASPACEGVKCICEMDVSEYCPLHGHHQYAKDRPK